MTRQQSRSRQLVTEQDVRAVPPGGQFAVPRGALVTPLARQVAMERGVTLREPGAAPALEEDGLRGEIVRVGRLLHQKGFVAATAGNISARLGPDRILATPSGRHKGFLRADELIVVDLEGQPVGPRPRLGPTSEMPMHLEVYRQRPEVGAVVHAHPPIAVALSTAGISLAEPMQPETVITLGEIPTTEYATPSTHENVEVIRDLIGRHDAIVLRRHGALTVGADPFDAYAKMEILEHTAHVAMLMRLVDGAEPLSPEQVEKLLALRERFGGQPLG